MYTPILFNNVVTWSAHLISILGNNEYPKLVIAKYLADESLPKTCSHSIAPLNLNIFLQ